MNDISFEHVCIAGGIVGIGAGLAPLVATTTIACSKIILINIIVNVAVGILTFGAYTASYSGASLIHLPPMMWKVSLILAAVGVGVAALSFTALAVNRVYRNLEYGESLF
jgi:hypothetical protein